jgi:hypothetical protein
VPGDAQGGRDLEQELADLVGVEPGTTIANVRRSMSSGLATAMAAPFPGPVDDRPLAVR